jgi:hypothetical protein
MPRLYVPRLARDAAKEAANVTSEAPGGKDHLSSFERTRCPPLLTRTWLVSTGVRPRVRHHERAGGGVELGLLTPNVHPTWAVSRL